MHRFWIGVITSLIAFCSCFAGPAGALVVRDTETCVRVCLIQYNRSGNIYALMQCMGHCGVYLPRHLTGSECRKAAGPSSRKTSRIAENLGCRA